jgi:squalene-hopene/tetraprenyl-beta-curcumene cyclase
MNDRCDRGPIPPPRRGANRLRIALRLVLAAGVAATALGSVQAAPPDPVLQKARTAVSRGIEYLHRTQETDGSWGHYPATTALAISGLLRNGKTETSDPAVARGVQFLVRSAQPNGAIYSNANPALALPNYNTCLAVMSLTETKNPVYRPIVRKALQYLEKVQFDEGEGIGTSSPMYGGIGYGDDPGDDTHPDLSNLQFALEALHEGGTPAGAPVFKKALIFLQRVQNRKESNDQAWVKEGPNDGGFVYTSQGGTPADEGKSKQQHLSYGSMTYAGLKSYIYAGVTKSDPRAQAAWSWIRGHYTVTEHPGMGSTSLYYYYHTMAKTLDVYGQRIVKDTKGGKHDWAHDLAAAIVAAQHPDGSWSNTNARYWENQPGLVTSYSLITLSYCLHGK